VGIEYNHYRFKGIQVVTMAEPGKARQVRTSFSEEKEAKRLLVLRDVAAALPRPAGPKVFYFLFSKK
jgi:hypothetical protein